MDMMPCGFRYRFGGLEEERNLLLLPGREYHFFICPVRSLVTMLNAISLASNGTNDEEIWNFYILLTVHLGTIRVNNRLDALFLVCLWYAGL
jgi:hypothetical protein